MAEQVDFSIVEGGLFASFLRHSGLADRVLMRIIVLTAVAWLPLLVITAFAGLAVGTSVKIPFLSDCGVYGRLLVAVPILLLIETTVDKRTRFVLREFITTGLVPEQEIPLFNNAVRDVTKRKDSAMLEIVLLVITYAISALQAHLVLLNPLTTWYTKGGSITPAGWYYVLVGLPLFHFLLLRWIWRIGLWALLLWRISRLNLLLLPIHPDQMGGLGFLGLSQIAFGLIGFAAGAVVSSFLMNGMIYQGESLSLSYSTMVIYVALAVLVNIAPVLVFTGKLIRARANGILEYGVIGQEYARLFDQKWSKGINPENEVILGSSDIQSLADLRNSFNIVQNMSIVAIDRKTAIIIAVVAAIPMVPLFLIAIPFDKIIAGILRMNI